MAVEVEAMRYRFSFGQPQHARQDTKIRVLWELLKKAHLGDSGQNQTPADAKPDQPVPEQPAFRYNPLHDVESLWWLCTYFVFNKAVILVNGVEPSMDPELKGNYSMQLQYASRLFWTQQFREWAMTRPGDFKDEVIHLHAVVRPAGYLLDTMRYRLQNQYRSIEETRTPITYMVASDITMQMIEDLGDIRADVKGLTIGEFKDDPRRNYLANRNANISLKRSHISPTIAKTEGKRAMKRPCRD